MPLFFLLFLIGLVNDIYGQKATPVWENQLFLKGELELNYRFFKPARKDTLLPLVLFFHGAGERGIDNTKQLKHIQHIAEDSFQKIFPCYVLVPQCPSGTKWVNVDWTLKSHTMPSQPSPSLKATMELLRSLLLNHNIDKRRIYVVGLSMGGFAVWDVLCRYPELFAAAIPICGGGDETKVHLIKHVPIWAFHGEKDKVVIPQRTKRMVEALQKLNAPVKMTIYPDLSHDAWTTTLHNPEVWQWLFLQSQPFK